MLWITRQQKDAKHVKNNACKRISIDQEVSRSYRADIDESNNYQEAIENPKDMSIDPPSYRRAIEIAIKKNN